MTGRSASFKGVTPAVKDTQARTWRERARAWLSGWPLIPITAGSAGFVALLNLPHPVTSVELPLPRVDRVAERAQSAAQAELVQAISHAPLSFDVRAVGEAFRQYGSAEAQAGTDTKSSLEELQTRARVVLVREGPKALDRLLAYQTQAFQQAVSNWEQSGVRSQDLLELGGVFFGRAQQHGWLDAHGMVVATQSELDVLFRARWLNLTALAVQPALRLTLNDWRLYYAFLLRHPAPASRAPALQQLAYVEALERKDPEYPALLARGILQMELGNYVSASRALKAHLNAHPDGAWQLRARNLLLASLQLSAP